MIKLEDFERKLQDKTMWLVVRYTVPGVGEWWDNNSGMNYRVNFKKALTIGNSGVKEVDASLRSGDAARDVALRPLRSGRTGEKSFFILA